jgi:hypothetical protein
MNVTRLQGKKRDGWSNKIRLIINSSRYAIGWDTTEDRQFFNQQNKRMYLAMIYDQLWWPHGHTCRTQYCWSFDRLNPLLIHCNHLLRQSVHWITKVLQWEHWPISAETCKKISHIYNKHPWLWLTVYFHCYHHHHHHHHHYHFHRNGMKQVKKSEAYPSTMCFHFHL